MIAFLYPYDAFTRSIQVKNPEFGDSLEPVSDTKTKTTMSGEIRSRIQNSSASVLKLSFIELSRTKALEFQDFLNACLGTKIKYVDPEGATWIGQLVTNPVEIKTVSRGTGSESRKEANSIVIEFEGVKQ